MNTISSLFKWIGNVIGADPSTMATTSKTVVGAINDLSQQISDIEKTLLWTNPNTSNTFGTQTISLDLTSYSGVEVWFMDMETNQAVLPFVRAMKGESGVGIAPFRVNVYRKFTPSDSGVTFTNGISVSSYGTADTGTWDAMIRPYKIYGIK